MAEVRKFDTGATRDADDSKYDYEGFYHPRVMMRFARYMHDNRRQTDGTLRASDNWQKGIPKDAYVKSGFRHFHEWWLMHRELPPGADTTALENSLCALIFNAQGYLFELLMRRPT